MFCVINFWCRRRELGGNFNSGQGMGTRTNPRATTVIRSEDTCHAVGRSSDKDNRLASGAGRLSDSDGVGRCDARQAGHRFTEVAGMIDTFVRTDPELARFTKRVDRNCP
jgi:hypothetical protein